MKLSFDNIRICRVASSSALWSLGGHTKDPIPTTLLCSNVRVPPIAPRSLSRVLSSADSRFQWSSWSSLSRFLAGSLPTFTLLSSCCTPLPQHSTYPDLQQDMLCIVHTSTSDIIRQTIHNSNRAIMTCKPRSSHHTAPSHQNK